MRNEKIVWMLEIAIFAALAYVLDFVKWSMPQGGSISFVMVPIIVMAFRRGILAGITTGALVGLLQIVTGMIYVAPLSFGFVVIQVVFEYIIAFAVIGLSSIFYNKFQHAQKNNLKVKVVVYSGMGILFAVTIRYVIHVLAGYIFWSTYAEGNALIYSIVYNATYMIPLTVITIIATVLLFLTTARITTVK